MNDDDDAECESKDVGVSGVGPLIDPTAFVSAHDGVTVRTVSDRRLGIGYQLWPAARALASFIDTEDMRAEWSQHPRVLELGAGCAVPSMLAAIRGAHVIATDCAAVAAEHTAANIALNEAHFVYHADDECSDRCAQRGCARVGALLWTSHADDATSDPSGVCVAKYDWIFLADCVYWEELFEPLIDTIKRIVAGSAATRVLIAQTKRRSHVEKRFFKRMKKTFVVSEVSSAEDDCGERIILYRAQLRIADT